MLDSHLEVWLCWERGSILGCSDVVQDGAGAARDLGTKKICCWAGNVPVVKLNKSVNTGKIKTGLRHHQSYRAKNWPDQGIKVVTG